MKKKPSTKQPERVVDTILFDLDDTLVQTHILFSTALDDIAKKISKETGIEEVEVQQAVARINVERYEEFKVNPEKIWPAFLNRVKTEFSLDDQTIEWLREKAESIYTTLPELIPGAIEVLDTLKAAGVKMAVVTHATEGWTRFKMDGNNLSSYFEYVHTVSVDEFKTAPDWQKALEKMKGDPERTAVIGDNLKGDVLAAASVGIEVLIWIHRPNAWSVYSKGELPPKTHVITALTEMLPIVFGAKEKERSKELKALAVE